MVLTHDQWIAIGTGVAAIFTGIAAIGTIGTLIYAIKSTNQARRETRALQNAVAQAKEREQADRICAWIHGDYHQGVLALLNSSDQPAYNVVVYWVYVQGAAWSTGEQAEKLLGNDPGRGINKIRPVLQVVPPGKFQLLSGVGNQDIMQGRPGVEIAFTDMGGRHWLRRATGTLEALTTSPFEHYGIGPTLPHFHPLTPWDQAVFPRVMLA